MTDIGVYTSMETLEEKMAYAKNPNYFVYWKLNNKPKSLDIERIFFAADGKWMGYFTIEQILSNTGKPEIYLDEWHPIDEDIERPPFRGFTYNVPEVGE